MSRLDEALLHLRSGEAAVLVDEDDPGRCTLVAASGGVDARILAHMAGEGAGEAALCADPDLALDEIPVSNRAGVSIRRIAAHGVLARAGMAEAAVDVIRLAGRPPVALTLALALPGGVLAQPGAAAELAARRGLPLVSIQDVVAERLSRETIVEAVASARLPSLHAASPLEVEAFRNLIDGSEHLAMIRRPLGTVPLVRLHSECLTGDALGSLRCDCGDQLRASLRLIAEHPQGGVVVYLRGQEGRGIGLANKIRAYALQDAGRDTVDANLDLGFPADLRSYGVAVQILRDLGVSKARVLTNNPAKTKALERYGIAVLERVALHVEANPLNATYLDTKRRKMGHAFEPLSAAEP